MSKGSFFIYVWCKSEVVANPCPTSGGPVFELTRWSKLMRAMAAGFNRFVPDVWAKLLEVWTARSKVI